MLHTLLLLWAAVTLCARLDAVGLFFAGCQLALFRMSRIGWCWLLPAGQTPMHLSYPRILPWVIKLSPTTLYTAEGFGLSQYEKFCLLLTQHRMSASCHWAFASYDI